MWPICRVAGSKSRGQITPAGLAHLENFPGRTHHVTGGASQILAAEVSSDRSKRGSLAAFAAQVRDLVQFAFITRAPNSKHKTRNILYRERETRAAARVAAATLINNLVCMKKGALFSCIFSTFGRLLSIRCVPCAAI